MKNNLLKINRNSNYKFNMHILLDIFDLKGEYLINFINNLKIKKKKQSQTNLKSKIKNVTTT